MRTSFLPIAAGFLSLMFTSLSFAQGLNAPVEKVFVPAGFDDNDNVEIMIYGHRPNGCYTLGRQELIAPNPNSANPNQFIFNLKMEEFSAPPSTGVCLQAQIEFLLPVAIGKVKQGIYEIVVNPGVGEIRKVFAIGKSNTDARDAADYAPVSAADIIKDSEAASGQALLLEGHYPLLLKGCARITEVIQERDAEDLLTVRPIMSTFYDESCGTYDLRYKLKVPLDIPFNQKGLLHVRKIDWQSYNRIVN